MFTNIKSVLAAALILGSASASLADDVKASGHARGAYAQAPVRQGLNADRTPSTQPTAVARPLTRFEKTWFDYQDHE